MQSKLDALYEQLHATYKAMPPRIPKQGIIFEKLPGKTANANEHQYRVVSGARFYQGGQDFCLDRKYCHWPTSDTRLAGCGSCGSVVSSCSALSPTPCLVFHLIPSPTPCLLHLMPCILAGLEPIARRETGE